MRSPISLLVPFLSFLSFAVTAHLHSNSSRPARDQISARQFRYTRAALDVCVDINESLILKDIDSTDLGLDLGRLFDDRDTCLCLSALPLVSDLDDELLTSLVDLIGEDQVELLVRHDVLSILASRSHGIQRSNAMVSSVQKTLLKTDLRVPVPTRSVTENVAPTPTLVLPRSMTIFSVGLMCQ